MCYYKEEEECVTILVLVETPLQCSYFDIIEVSESGHNPCFSGNSFAIKYGQNSGQTWMSHNPCFSGNSFAIENYQAHIQ